MRVRHDPADTGSRTLEETGLEILLRLHEMSDASEEAIADYALEASQRLTGSGLGYVAFLDDAEATLTMYAWSEAALAQCRIADKRWVYPVQTTGLWGEAVRQRRPIVTNNYRAPNPLKRGYPEGHARIHNHMNVPVFDSDRIVAVAGVGNKPGDYDASDVRRLTLLMTGMWQIIRRKRAEAERERLLEEVRRHAAELDATITSIPDGVIICGAEGEIVRLNDSARRILGLSPEQLALPLTERMRLLEAESPDGRPVPADQAPLFRALAGETVQGVVMVLRPRGPRCTRVSMSAAPIRTPDGTQRGAVAVLNDVTTLHEMEEQREDILRAVSHDLRTPLVSVGGFARLLLRQREQAGAPEPELGHLRHILAGARQMNALIQDLVDSVRIEAGQVRLNPQPVALREFIADVLGRAAGALETERIQIDLAPGIPPVLADASSLERVLLNLLSNALKYSPPGSPVVLAATSGGAKATVSVSNQGPGIAPEDLPRLFERFFRTKLGRQADGIGLGLHITKTLVECQGGRLWVDSRPGEGTTFTLTLPLA